MKTIDLPPWLTDLVLGSAAAVGTWTVIHTGAGPHARANPPVIDQVAFDRPSLCVGEESLASVAARSSSGDKGSVEVRIDRQPGRRRMVRAEPSERGKRKRISVAAFDQRGEATAVIAEISIGDCDARSHLRVEATPSEAWEGEVTFVATPVGPNAPDRGTFTWSFDDGTRLETKSPRVRHSYARRSHGTPTTDYVIEARFSDGTGREVSGRTSVGFANAEFASEKAPFVPIHAAREADHDGTPRNDRIRLWHSSSGPVRVEKAIAVGQLADGKTLPPAPIPVASLLASPVIAAGEGALISSYPELPRGYVSMEVRLFGHGSERRPFHGRLVLDGLREPQPDVPAKK